MSEAVECPVCPRHCQLQEGQAGFCRARANKEGRIESLTYGQAAAWHLDPIEKKPLYHFYPGKWIFSAGGYGCNLRCFFCQNYEISQRLAEGIQITPEQLAGLSRENGSIGICFTYSEPLVWYEMIAETAPLVKKQGGKVVLVSNGIIEENYLDNLLPFLDAANIDIKGFSEEFYQKYTGGKLEWVLNTVKRLAGKVHTELTTLVIPGLNDSPQEIQSLAHWLAGLKTPLAWHLSKYFPQYKSGIQETDENKLRELWKLAREILPYVYLGNVATVPPGSSGLAGSSGLSGSSTYCPRCGLDVVTRNWGIRMKTINGRCPECGQAIWGVGLS